MDPFHTQYRQLDDVEKAVISSVKNHATALYAAIRCVPDGREQSLALTKLEEAVMWAVKGVTE